MVPVGSFMMGSPAGETARDNDEGPQRKVMIAKAFAVGKYEVTFAEWDACVAAGGCKHNPGDLGWGRGKRPVINVSWDDITKEYLPWLNGKSGKTYHLLTEAEWEYAARAGTMTPYSTGQTVMQGQAKFLDFAYAESKTAVVGSFPPNRFGLHDMHGNVWEWTQDCYRVNYIAAPTDGSAVTSTSCTRVLRGGAWSYQPDRLRSAARLWKYPGDRSDAFGFRVARTFTP